MSSDANNNPTPTEDPGTASQDNNGNDRTTADEPTTQPPDPTPEPEPTTPTREPTTTPAPDPEPEPTPDSPPETDTPAQNTPTRNQETIVTSTRRDTIVTLVSTVTTKPITETPSLPAATLEPVSSSVISPSASASGDGNDSQSSGGLTGTTRVVVAVVVPIVGVALIAIGLLFLWKKRRRDRELTEQRRKAVEDYGFNPNSPGMNGGGGVTPENEQPYEMTENTSVGYRGWGSTNGGRNGGRQMSNMGSIGTSGALSPAGMVFPEGTYQDPNGYAGVAQSPSAASFPPGAPSTDGNTSNAPLIAGNGRPDTADSAVMAAIAAVGGADTGDGGIHRGISNASSNYSGVTHSDHSEIGIPPQHYQMDGAMGGYEEHNYSGPYQPYPDDGGIYTPPVIRDMSARRNTQIETPTSAHLPQRENIGIAQNF